MKKELDEIIDYAKTLLLIRKTPSGVKDRMLCTIIHHATNLAKPMQYVVNYKIINPVVLPGEASYSMGIIVSEFKELDGYFDDMGEIREVVLAKFNAARFLLALPPITIEQIIFVEV